MEMLAQCAKRLFHHNEAVAFLARLDCYLLALDNDRERYRFVEGQLTGWLRKVPEDPAVMREIVRGLVERRRTLGDKI